MIDILIYVYIYIRLLCNFQLFNQDGSVPLDLSRSCFVDLVLRVCTVSQQRCNNLTCWRWWAWNGTPLTWAPDFSLELGWRFTNSARQLRFGKNLPMRTTRSTLEILLAVHGEPRRIRRARTVWPRQSRRQMAVTVTQWPPICESIRAWSVAEPLLLDVGRVTVLHWKCTDYLDKRGCVCFRCKPRKRAELWEAADATFCILALYTH